MRLDGTHRGSRPVPGVAQPWVQLAPQRIVTDGKVVADALDLKIHEDSPPRVQAAIRNQRNLARV